MNVSLQNIDKVSAELTVKLEKADYQEKVDKELKSLRQKAQIDRKSTRLNSSHLEQSRMPSSA